MEYDQVNNFQNFFFKPSHDFLEFDGPNGNMEQQGISVAFVDQGPRAFWMTFLVCNLRNDDPGADTFSYDVHKFYVIYQGQKFYYKPLDQFQYVFYPSAYPSSWQTDAKVNAAFRMATQLGPDTDTFPKAYYPDLRYRFAIRVTIPPSPDPVDIGEQVHLFYDAPSTVLLPRFQAPLVPSPVENPVDSSVLGGVCRPPNYSPPLP